MLEDVINSFGLPSSPKSTPVPKRSVLEWMGSSDLETLGAVYAFLSKPGYFSRVSPRLSRTEWSDFAIRYFEKCLHDNKEGAWAHGRYAAAWDVASWYAALWRLGDVERAMLLKIKHWLARLYKSSDLELRRCIVDGALEHMFEDKAIRQFFADWKADQELVGAFNEASTWAEKKTSNT